MARIALENLYVVVYPHIDRYSYDTGIPDEVYLTRKEAQTLADECNAAVFATDNELSRSGKKYYVESLSDRLGTIKEECHREGENRNR